MSSLVPIAELKGLGRCYGVIHCRVICKRPIRNFSEGGVVTSVDLADKSGEIKAVAFNEDAENIDRWLQLNRVYDVSKFSVQTKRAQYSHSPHKLEIKFKEAKSSGCKVCKDDVSLPRKKYLFVSLRDVSTRLERGQFVDVIGVMVDTGQLQEHPRYKDGGTSDVRFVTLKDDSDFQVEVRLWDRQAKSFRGSNHPAVLAFSDIVISFSKEHGMFLDTTIHSSMLRNPKRPEADRLRKWFSAEEESDSVEEDFLIRRPLRKLQRFLDSSDSDSTCSSEDFPKTRKRGAGKKSHSEKTPSVCSAKNPGRPKRLHRQESIQVPPGSTAPRTGMDQNIHYSVDILEEYKDGLISEMKSLGAVLGIGAETKAIVSRHGSRNDHLLEILDLYITKKTPTWSDFCKALKRSDCFNNVRGKIEADHST